MWTLKRNTNNDWEWAQQIPLDSFQPIPRYQAQLVCLLNMAIVVGGRNSSQTSLNTEIEIFNFANKKWFKFEAVNLY